MYISKYDHSRLRERIMDGYHLESFSEIEGVDDYYLRHEIMKSHLKPSMLHRLGAQIKDYLMKLYVATFRTIYIQKTNNGERIM